MLNWPAALVEQAQIATIFVANWDVNCDLPQHLDFSGGMVWAIGSRLILSKAQKSAGANGPNHAGRVLGGSAMEVRSGAEAVIQIVVPIGFKLVSTTVSFLPPISFSLCLSGSQMARPHIRPSCSIAFSSLEGAVGRFGLKLSSRNNSLLELVA